MTRIPARSVALAGIVSSILCVVALHLLRTDLAPATHRLSEYASGEWGWLMTLAFVALGAGLVGFAAALRTATVGLAGLAAAATYASALFRTGTPSEDLHSVASTVAVLALVALAQIHTFVPAGSSDRPTVVLAVAAASFAALSPVLHESGWTGVGQRLLWAALLAWLLRVTLLGRPRSEDTADPPLDDRLPASLTSLQEEKTLRART